MSQFPVEWEQLYKVFLYAYQNKVELRIHETDETYITVESIERRMSGCGQCHDAYECFSLTGLIRANYFDDLPSDEYLPYSAQVSQYNMFRCKCDIAKKNASDNGDDDDEPMEFLPLFKGYVENTKQCVCHVYVDQLLVIWFKWYCKRKGMFLFPL
jgi:hypothetical protein